MGRIKFTICNGKIHKDFENFPSNSCSDEEDLIRLFYALMGVKTDVEYSETDRDREREAETLVKRNKLEK